MKDNFTKATLFVAFISILSSGVKAQEFKDRFFFSNGVSVYTELFFGRTILSPYVYDPTNTNTIDAAYLESYKQSAFGGSIFTYTANFRYNLSEPDNNSAFSVNVPVGVGIMASEYGTGDINLPIFLSWNTGNVSTLSADKNKGFTIGLGFEYYNMALFKTSKFKDYPGAASALDAASFVEPCLNIGFRYWNSKNIAKEFNLKVGYGPKDTQTVGPYTVDNGRVITVKLTWFRFNKY